MKRYSTGTAATISALLLALPFVASASVAQIAFTSSPQTIEPGAVSDRITVEAQDASGNAVNGQTLCVIVSSNSPTGQFSTNGSNWSASSTNSLALTVSSNQYRRNFYYQDVSSGTFTLSARAGVKPSTSTCGAWKASATWTESQPIIVVVGASQIAPEPLPSAQSGPPASSSAPHATTKTKKASSRTQGSSYSYDSAARTVDAQLETSSPAALSQTAAADGTNSVWWWVLAIALIVVGTMFLILSRRHAKTEWNITEDPGSGV